MITVENDKFGQEQERFESHLIDLLGLEDDTYIPPHDSDESVYFLAELLGLLNIPYQHEEVDIDPLRKLVNLELSKIKRAIAFGLCNSFNEYKLLGGFTDEEIYKEHDHYAEERKKRGK